MNTLMQSEQLQYLSDLNLDYLIEFMCSDRYPLPRWNPNEAKRCSLLYKNFLLLQKKNPHFPLVPTKEIDEFWHNHILYTKEYTRDCQAIFGFYLHHEPATPTDNPKALVEQFQQTKALYFSEFQETLATFR